MEKFKKTLMTGIAVFVLTGCSNDGLPEKTIIEATSNPGATSTEAIARAAKNAAELSARFANNSGEGWFEEDSVWIYTLNSMNHNSYLLSEGAGSGNATFTRTSGTDNYENSGTLYALTSAKYLYGFSATMDGNAQVSVTIPNRYKVSDVGAPEGCSRRPVPYWGIVTFGDDGKLQTAFQGLTSLLKIDLSILPADTRAVVLTTHSYTEFGDGTELDEGDEEPLSGTFDTVLSEGAKLASNPIFYSYDTLRVNLTTGGIEQYRHLYLPVVAASYKNLHVIAVTGDYRFPYLWDGKLLKTYKPNSPFPVNTIVALEPESTGIKTPKM